MSIDSASDTMDDIRWTKVCAEFDELMNRMEMPNWERMNMGGRLISTVIKQCPPDQRMRWFAFVIHELSSQSAELNVEPGTVMDARLVKV